MSRTIIHTIVIPDVLRVLVEDRVLPKWTPYEIRDENLEEFLEEEMRRAFGVIGANGCQHLEEQIKEAKKNDPFAYDELLRQLLKKYKRISEKMRQAKKNDAQGPPDRFAELRKRFPLSRSSQEEEARSC
jgi:hypothetical protein